MFSTDVKEKYNTTQKNSKKNIEFAIQLRIIN